jgi:hypothetical protein
MELNAGAVPVSLGIWVAAASQLCVCRRTHACTILADSLAAGLSAHTTTNP